MNARRTPWWHAAIALVLGLGVGAGVAVLGESYGTTLIGTCLLYTSGDRPLDACQLIFRRYAFGARSGRFGTDVDDVLSLIHIFAVIAQEAMLRVPQR